MNVDERIKVAEQRLDRQAEVIRKLHSTIEAMQQSYDAQLTMMVRRIDNNLPARTERHIRANKARGAVSGRALDHRRYKAMEE